MNPSFFSLKQQVIQSGLLSPEDSVLLMFSGGSDSVFLFQWLVKFLTHPLRNLFVFYGDHGLRPEGVAYEKELIRRYAAQWGVRVSIRNLPIEASVKRWKCSAETAGRNWRRKMALHLAKIYGISVVVSAHHLDDACESFLMQLCRGSKTGLVGIRAQSFLDEAQLVRMVRPLLSLSKSEILQVVNEQGWAYSEDKTNTDLQFSRNRVRHEILPTIQAVMPHYAPHWGALMMYLQDVGMFISAQCAPILAQTQVEGSDIFLSRALILSVHPFIQGEVIYRFLAGTYSDRDFSDKHVASIHVEKVRALILKGRGSFSLPLGRVVQVTRDRVGVRLDASVGID